MFKAYKLLAPREISTFGRHAHLFNLAMPQVAKVGNGHRRSRTREINVHEHLISFGLLVIIRCLTTFGVLIPKEGFRKPRAMGNTYTLWRGCFDLRTEVSWYRAASSQRFVG
jgi:hypothetical protein